MCLCYKLDRLKEKRRHKATKKRLEEKTREKREEKRKKQEKKRKNQEEEELQGKRKHARSMNYSEFVQGATTEGLQVIFLARFLY